MAAPKDRASEPSRKLVMDKSKLMPPLATPEEETVRNYRMKHGKAKFAEIQNMVTSRQPKEEPHWKSSIGGNYHEGERRGERLPAALPAKKKAEKPKTEKPVRKERALKNSAAAPKPAFSSPEAKKAWYIKNGFNPPE